MYFWPYIDLVKSNKAKGQLVKAYEKQKFFLKAILQDYASSIVYLGTILDGSSLPALRTIIIGIKSTKFPKLSLFYSIDRTWNKIRYSGNFGVLCMPHIIEEAKLIMNNLIPYLHY